VESRVDFAAGRDLEQQNFQRVMFGSSLSG
jgi:hypothetical protein